MSRISDHLPYFTFLNFLTYKCNDPSRSFKIQTWNAECIHHFQTELNSANIDELLDTTLKADPTKNLNILNNVIYQAKNKHLTYSRVKFNKHKHKNSNWITKGIVRSISYSRKQFVQYGDILSQSTDILMGVPQGSILGPLLFIIYILKLKLSQYPSIHTNYIITHCTTL